LIPVLETPQGAIFETGAILLWLGDTHGGLGPAPHSTQRGAYLKWLFFTANTLHPALRMMFYPDRYIGTDPDQREALRKGLEPQITDALARLEDVAATRPDWLGADLPSGLDFYIAACLRWCALYPADRRREWFDPHALPALLRMCRHIETLPCTRALHLAEGTGTTPFSAPDYAKPPHGSAT
jgi:glutathione S-transferase